MSNNIAIIPARGRSKRIPRKNIRDFLGKPIIAYPIIMALSSGLFEEVMVSTDDSEIADIAKHYGAKVPFQRSDKNANDYAITFDVIKEVLENYKSQNINFDLACCIYPCTPLLNEYLIKQGLKKLKDEKLDFVFPIVQYSSPIQRAYRINNNKITPFDNSFINTRTQDLEKAYYDSGQFYWFTIQNTLKENKFSTQNIGGIIIDELQTQDIDNETDWLLAELKYKLKNKYEKI